MSWQRILIRHSGYWDRLEYRDGDEVLVYMPLDHISRDYLLREIQDIVGGGGIPSYLLFYMTSTNDGKKVKVLLKTDTDLLRLLVEQNDEAIVYVVDKGKSYAHGIYQTEHDRSTSKQSPVPPLVNLGGSSSAAGNDNVEEEELVSTDEEEDSNHRRRELFKSMAIEFDAWIRKPGQIDRILGSRNISSDDQADVEGNDGADIGARPDLRNWVIPVDDFDHILPLGWVDPSGPDIGELSVGTTFQSKDDLSIAVGIYHMENRVEYTVDRSNRSRLGFVCKHGSECNFKLRAVQHGSIWRVIKLNLPHTCQMELNRVASRQVPAKVVAAFFARKLVNEGVVLKPKDMMRDMLSLFGIVIDYSFALRSRNIAIEMTYGEYERSYQMLHAYLHVLREHNPRTIYDIQTTRDCEFQYMFLALGQCIDVFDQYLRPVIVVDGTHLKGKNKGVLFVAVTKDGNEGVFPLAVGIGPIENDDSWAWFLTRLRNSFGQPDNLLIVSDQHLSIRNAVENVYPNVVHGLCYYHLQKNLARYGAHIAVVFKNAAYSYRDGECQKNLSVLEALSKEGAYKRLVNIGVERWSRSKCPIRRFSFMTSNAAESMNARLLWARRLPICSLLEVYRKILEKWFDERRKIAMESRHVLTQEAMSKLSKSVEFGRRLTVRGTTSHVFKVEDDNVSYLVDLQNMTCECREFELDMIPCCHAVAAIRHAGLQTYDFVALYFKQQVYLQAYAVSILPVPHPNQWNVSTALGSYVVRAPVILSQAGRPRMSRARSAIENNSSRRRQVCSRCQGTGHNRRVCTVDIAIGGVDLNAPLDGLAGTERRRQPKKCSICRDPGHTRSRCPNQVLDD